MVETVSLNLGCLQQIYQVFYGVCCSNDPKFSDQGWENAGIHE